MCSYPHCHNVGHSLEAIATARHKAWSRARFNFTRLALI